jgi:3-hydroxyacyl-[acyl-carrier-protein] dehydratase
MAQVASFAMYPALKNDLTLKSRFQCVLVGVDQARFRVPVVPGDVLRIETEVTGARTYLWSFLCKAYVEDKLVAEAKIMANLMPMKDQKDS